MKVDSVRKSFIFSVMLRVVSLLVPLIITPYLSRVLTPTGIGDYAYSFSIVSYFVLIVSFGFTDYGTQEIAKNRSSIEKYSEAFWNVFIARLFLLIVSIVGYTFLAYKSFFGSRPSFNVYLAFLPLLIGMGLDSTYLFQGLEKFELISLITVSFKVISVILIFMFVRSKNDLWKYVLIQSCVTLLISLCSGAFVRKKIKGPEKNSLHVITCFRKSLLFFLPTIAVSLYTMVDRTMLGILSSKVELAYYQQAYRIEEIPCNIINAISPVMLSRFSYLINKNNESEIKNKRKQLFGLMAIITCPCILGLYFVANRFVPAFLGDDYSPSVLTLYILIPQVLVTTVSNNIRNIYYAPRKKLPKLTVFLFSGATINLLLNYWFIPHLGANGAAIASVISETVICILIIGFSREEIEYIDLFAAYIKPALSAIVMIFVLYSLNIIFGKLLFKDSIIILIDIVIGAFIYYCSCFALQVPIVVYVTKTFQNRIQSKHLRSK